MKCSYCGSELEKGADFCPECGMILGLNDTREDKKAETEEPEFKVPEYTPNVFKAIDAEEEEETVPAMELESDGGEEVAPVTENIPEYVSQVPDYVPMEFEDISSGESMEEGVAAENSEREEVISEQQEIEEELAAPEYVPAPDMPAEDELDVRIPEGEITYPEYESYKNAQTENEVINPTEEEYEEIKSGDMYVEPGKKKNGVLTVFVVIAVICVLVGGVYAVKNIFPSLSDKDTTTTEALQADATSEETTEDSEETTEEDTTEEETTEEDTTEEESSAADETTEDAEEDTTLAEDEEETPVASTTKPVTTTSPATTKPATTVPATTKPAVTTTKPSTTKPATTTDPYGINDVEVKKPSKINSKTYIIYCTAEGVILRNEASKSSERVLYLSKGADLTVYGKENGYYYVRSNRYGVYGWVSASYTSDSRPEAETTKVYKNTVAPDKKYDEAQVKYTTNGLNLRKGPGTDYDVVSLIPKNYPVKVIGYKKGVSGWAYVTDTTYGLSGWVSTAYLK